MIIRAELKCKQTGCEADPCAVDKVIELPSPQFQQFSRALLADYDFIAENKNAIRHDGDTRHCLLILDAEGKDGFLVDPQGYNYARYRFLTRNGIDRYDPARFLDYKLEVLQMLLYCLPRFDPEQETEFLKYAKHYVLDGLLFCRMMVEAGSFASLAEYRHVRQIGAIYNNSAKTAQKSFPSLPSKADTRMKAYLRMNC